MQFSVEPISPIRKSPIVPPLSDSNIDFVVSAGENKKFEERENLRRTPMNRYLEWIHACICNMKRATTVV